MHDKGLGHMKVVAHMTLQGGNFCLSSLFLGHCVDQQVSSWMCHCNMQIGAYGTGIYRMLQTNDFCLSC